MKKLRFFSGIILVLCCNFCNVENKRDNEITKVCLASGGCYGECPFLSMEIDSSLNYKFYGGIYAQKQGFYLGKITQGFWDTLNMKFEHISYAKMDTSYQKSVDDLSIELVLYYKGTRKHVIGQSSSIPDSTMNVINWLLHTYKVTNLKPTQESLRFETTIQTPL